MSIDLALSVHHDLEIKDGDLFFKKGNDQIAQQVLMLLKTIQGEWFLNIQHGIPYFKDFFGKKSSRVQMQSILTVKIKEIKGVLSVKSFDLKVDNEKRELFIKMMIVTENGEQFLEATI